MILIFLFIILNIDQVKSSLLDMDLTNQTDECVSWIETHVYENTQLHKENSDQFILVNFKDFTQLEEIKCKNVTIEIKSLQLNAETNILIEQNINLNNILNLIKFAFSNETKFIQIGNILGFNQYFHQSKSTHMDLAEYKISFNDVNFDFYLNKTLITKEICKPENFFGKEIDYFWPISNVIFNEVSYTKSICPFVFINCNIEHLALYQITNSLIFKNRLEFMNIDQEMDLNTHLLKYLELQLVFEELNTKLLNPHIFGNVKVLEISGSPFRIETKLFEVFSKLEYVFFSVQNLKYLFHQGIEWTTYLNKDLNVNMRNNFELRKNSNRIKLIDFNELFIETFSQVYIYPDEDLCLFKEFPHKQLVIPSMFTPVGVELCSCPRIWLMQNYKIYFNSTSLHTSKFRFEFEFILKNLSLIRYCMQNFSLLFDACQFDDKFKTCSNLTASNLTIDLSAYSVYFYFEWFRLVLQVYVKSFLSNLGLITNCLVMLVIKNKENIHFQRNFNNIMYKHIFYNSMFNFLFCLIQSFSLMNICIFTKSSFCSSVYKTNEAQYFKIIFIEFLGNSLRLCCNFSVILFSISRFYISTAKKSKWFLIFEKLNLKLFYFLMFISCSLWSMFKLFEFRPNEIYSSYDKNFPYNRYDLKYCLHWANIYTFLSSGCKIFPILNLINNVLNNILYLFISLVIDICMIRFANQNYQHKKELFHDPKHLDEALAHKKKIRKLIITNGILYFFSHIPEFVSTLLLILFKQQVQGFCFQYFSCTEINETFETFGLICICLQFFVYKHFDYNFYQSFSGLKRSFFTFVKSEAKKLFKF